jgi:hypothetical protein
MNWKRIGVTCAVSLALMACQKTEQGVLQPIPPLAGLRYVNLVNDTGALDFRVINFIGDAPSAGAATFRTGGAPYGISTNFLPPHLPVEAGREVHIRVFMDDTLPQYASQVVFDTTCTFTASKNYTFYLYGSARASTVHALVSLDSVPTLTGTNIAVRTINLASTVAPTLTGPNVDVDFVQQAATSPLGGTATFGGVAYKAVTNYTTMAASGTFKAVVSDVGTRTFTTFAVNAPAGVVGTAALNPVAGTLVPGSALSVVVVPPSDTTHAAADTTAFSRARKAPKTAAFLVPTVLFLIDQKPPLTAP